MKISPHILSRHNIFMFISYYSEYAEIRYFFPSMSVVQAPQIEKLQNKKPNEMFLIFVEKLYHDNI